MRKGHPWQGEGCLHPAPFTPLGKSFTLKLGEGIFPPCERMVAQLPMCVMSEGFPTTSIPPCPQGRGLPEDGPPSCSSPPSDGTLNYHHLLLKQRAAPWGDQSTRWTIGLSQAGNSEHLMLPGSCQRRQPAEPSASQLQSTLTPVTATLHLSC